MGLWRLCVLVVLCAAPAAAIGHWKKGRATYYGDQPWLWDIHQGSCGLGYLWPDIGTGWDVAALPDAHPAYGGSCGRCYEVKCDPTSFSDNYGNHMYRGSSCYDSSWSVVVKITDTCPCNYSQNYYSNKRWLSERRWGVIGLQYREVPCDHKPNNEAPPAKDPTPGLAPPPGAKRPAWAQTVVTQEVNSGFSGGFQRGWWDRSYNVGYKKAKKGPSGRSAKCAKVYPGGAVAMQTYKGRFKSRVSMEASIDVQWGTPNLSVTVSGAKGGCAPVDLVKMTAAGYTNGFAKIPIYLGLFDKALQRVQAYASEFKGCAGNRPEEIDTIEFKNNDKYPIDLCVDEVKLL